MEMLHRFRCRVWSGIPAAAIALVLVSSAAAQAEPGAGDGNNEKPAGQAASAQKAGVPTPAITSLGGVSLGMSADEAKEKLGRPDVSDASGMLFTPSKTQSVQIGLDDQGKVRTIAYIYNDGDKDAPTFEQVFGPDVAKPEASDTVYKMVSYPDAGFWLSYSVSNAGSGPMTVITMRRVN